MPAKVYSKHHAQSSTGYHLLATLHPRPARTGTSSVSVLTAKPMHNLYQNLERMVTLPIRYVLSDSVVSARY